MTIDIIPFKFFPIPEKRGNDWQSHMMAPSAYFDGSKITVFFGARDYDGISRIRSLVIHNLSDFSYSVNSKIVLDVGMPGTFDDNGVFPGSVIVDGSQVLLSYTGFELSSKIPHYNFNGLAVYDSLNQVAHRINYFPILDRSDEGLYVRAGMSAIRNIQGTWDIFYSAGSSFELIENKMRPNYDIYSQTNIQDLTEIPPKGNRILEYRKLTEHGLGRPQIIRWQNDLYLFYTIRRKNFPYRFGIAKKSTKSDEFQRLDDKIVFHDNGNTNYSQMAYFPAPLVINNRLFIFLNGNDFGRTGIAICEVHFH